MVIKLIQYGESVGTRILARSIRKEIESNNEIVLIDFDGVRVVSNSFADELIGVFIRQHGYDKLKSKYKFKNSNAEVKETIKQVIFSCL